MTGAAVAVGARRARARPRRPPPFGPHGVGTIEPIPFDSTPGALDVQRGVWHRLGPSGRVLPAIQMSEETRRVTLAGIRARYPALDPNEERRLLIEHVSGVDPGRL